ncbi:MAG: DUF2764 family protein [Lentisphaeria bacterium]|nr:DUF2764 family protein [Lentisphaeria bacterium]
MIYPFFSAVLPVLDPGRVPELSVEQFDAMAREELSAREFARLTAAGEPQDPVLPVYDAMRQFRECLNYRIALIRAERLKVSEQFEMPGELYGEIDFALSQALSVPPLEREKIVDAALWRKLDELETGHEMDLEHLCIYRMRLQILEKYCGRSEESGRGNFEAALEKLSGSFNEP